MAETEDDLERQIIELWMRLQGKIAGKWNRTLPFGDYFVDR